MDEHVAAAAREHQLQVRGKRVKCPIEFKETLLKPG
jgi:hypothetical protein